MHASVAEIGALLLHYKYFILAPAVLVEGPVAILLAGFLISLGYMSFWPAYALVVFGDVMGDFTRYSVGRFGGQHLVLNWGRHLGFDERHIKAIEELFQKRTGTMLLIAKFAYGIGSIFHACAGMVRVPIAKFFSHNIASSLVKSALLISVGYYFGHTISDFDSYLEVIGPTLVLVLVICVFVWASKYGKGDKIQIIK